MSSEEVAPAAEGKTTTITPRASPTKTDGTAADNSLPNFTEKEERVLKIVSFPT